MFCHSCGNALPQKMKYCNRCGALLITTDSVASKNSREKRLDTYLDGVFWITVFGLAFVFGGYLILSKAHVPDWVQYVYVAVSSAAFLLNFIINLSTAIRMMKGQKEFPDVVDSRTAELPETSPERFLNSAPVPTSITENTTRSFEPASNIRTTRVASGELG